MAYPVLIWQLLDAVAALVDWHVAEATEYDHILVLIVATVTYHALSVFLSAQCSASKARYLLVLLHYLIGVLRRIAPIASLPLRLKQLKDVQVLIVVLALLRMLHMLEEVPFLPRGVAAV